MSSGRHRFRFLGAHEGGGIWRLGEDEAQHLRQVLRLEPGTEVEVTDGAGAWAEGKILRATGKTAEIEAPEIRREEKPELVLEIAIGALKPGALDDLIPPLTELGIDGLHVILQKGTAKARMNDKARSRWDRIAAQAIKQCKRAWLPRIECHDSLSAYLENEGPADARYLLEPGADGTLLNVATAGPTSGVVRAAVGGERGFAAAEVEAFLAAGYRPVALGPFILRATTATLAVGTLLTSIRDSRRA